MFEPSHTPIAPVASDSAVGIAAITINRAARGADRMRAAASARAIFSADPADQPGRAAEVQARASRADRELVTVDKE